MSGGGLIFIQNHSASDIVEDSQLLEAMQHAAERLVEYGELGQKARMATAAAFTKASKARDEYLKMVDELDDLLFPLKDVWQMLDFQGAGDASKDQVVDVLERYNKRRAQEEL